MPRVIVALSTVRGPARFRAVVRRALGRPGTVRLFVAFDDPSSAVAVLGLADRLATRRVELVIEPVVERGIPGDPAVEAKRRYAVVDAGRLAQRDGRSLSRTEPLDASETAFLATWAATAPAAFTVAAMRHLWFESDGPIRREPFVALWREHAGGEPPPDGPVFDRPSERSMRRRRLYDTPVAVLGGQWFFAHERLPQIEHALDDLGWRAAA
jgi:2-hydroxychromene-2-carboxylate isomerase